MKIDITRVKIFVTIPLDYTHIVRKAICEAGAGNIGNYSYCTTSMKSTGTFIPNEISNPHIGEKNRLEMVEEDMLQVVCDVENVKKVIRAIRSVHPYEEPAIDIVPLLDEANFN